MTRNLKVLGLALVAVLAMSAMVASAASAATFTATSGAKITAEDTGKIQLKVTGQTITCSKALFSGTAPAASFTEIKVNAEYNECKTGLGTAATVKGFGQHGEANPCSFNLQSDGKADLNCPAGQEVTIEAATCTVHIGSAANQNLGTLTYTNNGAHVDIGLGITGITANHTDGFLCPLTSSGVATGAELVTPAAEPVTAKASVGTLVFDK